VNAYDAPTGSVFELSGAYGAPTPLCFVVLDGFDPDCVVIGNYFRRVFVLVHDRFGPHVTCFAEGSGWDVSSRRIA
jgi:hypothetical protein